MSTEIFCTNYLSGFEEETTDLVFYVYVSQPMVLVQPIRLIKPYYRISLQETELFTNGFHSK